MHVRVINVILAWHHLENVNINLSSYEKSVTRGVTRQHRLLLSHSNLRRINPGYLGGLFLNWNYVRLQIKSYYKPCVIYYSTSIRLAKKFKRTYATNWRFYLIIKKFISVNNHWGCISRLKRNYKKIKIEWLINVNVI